MISVSLVASWTGRPCLIAGCVVARLIESSCTLTVLELRWITVEGQGYGFSSFREREAIHLEDTLK